MLPCLNGMGNAGMHTRYYRLRYYEMDRYGRATPLTLLSLFEETAFSHFEQTGFSVFELRDRGFGWVLLHGSYRVSRYPAYRETFSVSTRLVAARRFYGLREFVVRDGRGNELGRCESMWAFYDMDRRKPSPILPEMLSAWGWNEKIPLSRSTPLLDPPGPERVDPSRSYDVRFSDIDTNGHVNNVNYMEWALEAVPPDFRDSHTLAEVQGVYCHQVRAGQTVRVAKDARYVPGAGPAYELAVYAEGRPNLGGRPDPVAYARTVWSART